ncbi:MAG: hypothetical protein AB7K24_16200 [Gemmataceae bacterium]
MVSESIVREWGGNDGQMPNVSREPAQRALNRLDEARQELQRRGQVKAIDGLHRLALQALARLEVES